MKNRNSLVLGVGLSALLLALFSCSFFESLKEKESPREIVFDHKAHVADNDMECVHCHAGAVEKARAGMPPLSECLDCHEDPGKGTAVARALGILGGRRKAGQPLWQMVHKEGDLLYSHAAHSGLPALVRGKKPACVYCHGDVGGSPVLTADAVAPMRLCMACHERGHTPEAPPPSAKPAGKGAGKPAEKTVKKSAPPVRTGKAMTRCAVCHRVWRKDTPPKSHRKLWHHTHGEEIRFGFDRDKMYYCNLCHDESNCVRCHQMEKPRSHTAFFRTRGHGIEAEISRERCLTCHRQDYCVRCHKMTRPRSHTGSWGSAPYRHCSGCHLNMSGTGCGVCHRSAPHAGAPLYPRDAAHAGNCTMLCHTYRHPDPGPVCTTCHK
jgi:hypothetical protein